MSKTLQERIRGILNDFLIQSVDKKVFEVAKILFFYARSGKTFAHMENHYEFEIVEKINQLEKKLKPFFIRTHRFYLANERKVIGVSRLFHSAKLPEREILQALSKKENAVFVELKGFFENTLFGYGEVGEFQLRFPQTEIAVPISEKYENKIKKHFDIKTFTHLVPDNPRAKKFRELKLKDFGFRELRALNKKSKKDVEEFKEKFDIKQFSRPKMLRYFRQITVNEVDKVSIIRNIIWQMFRWIKEGIEEKSDGNIRSLWYKIKAVLAYHSNVFQANDVDTFYNVLSSMIEKDRLFNYKDFGFADMNISFRGVGKKKPEIILASEKNGHFFFIKKLAFKLGCSFISLKGEPSHISMEYFADELNSAFGTKKKEVKIFIITDIDPAGYSISRNFAKELTKQGLKIKRKKALVTLNSFSDEETEFFRYPVVRFEKRGDEITPIKPAIKSRLTKAMRWFFNEVKDERLYEKVIRSDREIHTIFGIESDAADRLEIQKRFLGLLKEK